MEKSKKLMIPGKLIRYLIFLWLAAINIGVDFGLLMYSAKRNPGMIILVFLMIVGIIFAVYCTIGIVNLFREEVSEAENQLI